MSMTEEVGRLHREKQVVENQISDLFAFYTKQKSTAPMVSSYLLSLVPPLKRIRSLWKRITLMDLPQDSKHYPHHQHKKWPALTFHDHIIVPCLIHDS